MWTVDSRRRCLTAGPFIFQQHHTLLRVDIKTGCSDPWWVFIDNGRLLSFVVECLHNLWCTRVGSDILRLGALSVAAGSRSTSEPKTDQSSCVKCDAAPPTTHRIRRRLRGNNLAFVAPARVLPTRFNSEGTKNNPTHDFIGASNGRVLHCTLPLLGRCGCASCPSVQPTTTAASFLRVICSS